MSTGRSRLVCRLRGHDDAVLAVGVVGGVGVARLCCDRCARSVWVPNRATPPLTLAERVALTDVATVDRGALELLMLTAAVDAAYAQAWLKGGQS